MEVRAFDATTAQLLAGHVGRYGSGLCPLRVEVEDRNPAAAGEKRPGHGLPVHARADHGDRRGVRTSECLRGQSGRRAGSKRGQRGGVEQRQEPSARRVGQEHRAHHGRQAPRRVARKRADPLEQREPAAVGGHGPKVPGRIRRHVDLRRHRPFLARVGDERIANRLQRPLRRDRFVHVRGAEERNGH